jgi:hypothetical protein
MFYTNPRAKPLKTQLHDILKGMNRNPIYNSSKILQMCSLLKMLGISLAPRHSP